MSERDQLEFWTRALNLPDFRVVHQTRTSADGPICFTVRPSVEVGVCPHCHKSSEIFSHGGAKDLADKNGIPFLGSVPLDPSVCQTGEEGKPISVSQPDSAPAKAFRELARKVAAQVSIRNATHKPLEIKMVKA